MILIYLYLISFSLIGYGIIVSKYLSIKTNCFGIYGILGITFLAITSYLSSIFISHNMIFNFIILLIGLLIGVYSKYYMWEERMVVCNYKCPSDCLNKIILGLLAKIDQL